MSTAACLGLLLNLAWLLLLAACGAGAADVAADHAAPPVDASSDSGQVLAGGLPGLPAPAELPRAASLSVADCQRYGREFEAALPTAGLDWADGTALQFVPGDSLCGNMLPGYALAIYQFNLPGYAGISPQITLDWSTPPPAGQWWIGLTSWRQNRWEWFASTAEGIVSPDWFAPYIAEDGRLYLAVVVGGSDAATLSSIRLGTVADAWQRELLAAGRTYGCQLRLDDQGTPHAVYACDQGLFYATRTAGDWQASRIVGLAGLALSAAPRLCLTADRRPYVVWLWSDRQNLLCGWIEGNAWMQDVVATLAQESWGGFDIALNAAGQPQIAYFDAAAETLVCAVRDEAGWHQETVDHAEASAANVARFRTSPAGQPELWYAIDAGALYTAQREPGGWNIDLLTSTSVFGLGSGFYWDTDRVYCAVPTDFPLPAARYSLTDALDCSFDAGGKAHLCLAETAGGAAQCLVYYFAYDSGGWTDTPRWIGERFAAAADFRTLSLAMDSEQRPCVVYACDDSLDGVMDGLWYAQRQSRAVFP